MRSSICALLAAGFLGVSGTPVPAAAELVMVQERGCIWCARWDDEIAPVYPKTTEGKAAPLRRIDISDRDPADFSFARRVAFTPTFVLVDGGRELGRIEGYPGEDFFWPMLDSLLISNGITTETQ